MNETLHPMPDESLVHQSLAEAQQPHAVPDEQTAPTEEQQAAAYSPVIEPPAERIQDSKMQMLQEFPCGVALLSPEASQMEKPTQSSANEPVMADVADGQSSRNKRIPGESIDRAAQDMIFTDRAANPAEYKVYESQEAHLPDGTLLHLFAASRVGLGHLQRNMPCQDSCLYRIIPHGAVLTDADGISACMRSEVGSLLACQLAADAVEEASLQIPEEDAFIRKVCSDDFYAAFRNKWLEAIQAHWLENGGAPDEDPRSYYGTTVLVAVITDNWYVTLNLGDGQILLFNELECMKIQLVDKESQAPSSLIYDDYLEDVRRGVWPRNLYKGILIMTDGMNDRMSFLPWYACRDYSNQAAQRFMKYGEPLQPFIYSGDINGIQRTFDVSRQRSASDDFSVVMAINGDYNPQPAQWLHTAIQQHLPQVSALQLLRRVGRKVSYMVKLPNSIAILLVMPQNELVLRDPRLTSFSNKIKVWEERERWADGGFSFALYDMPEGVDSLFLEEGVQAFCFKSSRQYHSVPDSFDPVTGSLKHVVEPLIGQDTVLLRLLINDLVRHLRCYDLRLNEMALLWIRRLADKNGTLLIPREVLSEITVPDPSQPWYPDMSQLSPALLGYVSFHNQHMAVYNTGAAASSDPYYLFDSQGSAPNANRFFRVVRKPGSDIYGLMNISKYSWNVTAKDPASADIVIAPNHTVSIADGRRIKVMDGTRVLLECTFFVL